MIRPPPPLTGAQREWVREALLVVVRDLVPGESGDALAVAIAGRILDAALAPVTEVPVAGEAPLPGALDAALEGAGVEPARDTLRAPLDAPPPSDGDPR